MKRKIIIGSLFAVFILMMVPSVPAVQYNSVIETNKSQILERLKDMDIDEIRERIKGIDIDEFKENIKNTNIPKLRQILALLMLMILCPTYVICYMIRLFAWWVLKADTMFMYYFLDFLMGCIIGCIFILTWDGKP